ncbi:putative cytochrome P450 [Helianthus annuus]|nr:putative cytochrome P450 [Helianthus annuus]
MIGVLEENYGSTVDISALFDSLTTNIVYMAQLGKTSDVLELKTLIKKFYMFTFFSVGSYVPWLSWVDRLTGLVGRAETVAKEFDAFLEGVIEEHVRKTGGEDGTTGFTFQRDTVKAIIMDVFLGGMDTASKSLEWVMTELVRHPRVMNKLQHEVAEISYISWMWDCQMESNTRTWT